MKSPRLHPLFVALVVLASGCAQGSDRGVPQRGIEDGGGLIHVANAGMSLDQAVSMVEKRFKARVVRTEVRNEGDRKIYVLRLLNDAGRVWTVRVDASSGSVN